MKTKLTFLAALSALTFNAVADNDPAYWVGTDGKYVRGGFGECVRTISWTPEKAIAGCEGGSMAASADKKESAPVKPAPAPVAAEKTEPAAAPAVVATAPAAPAESMAAAEPQYRNLSLSSGATFELGGSTLSSKGKSAVAAILGEFEGETIRAVVVEGHTDDRGAASFNQQLSEKRAAAVRAELIANGVSADVIETVGFGESRPVADNDTREGRAQNRRVDIKIDARTRQL